MLFKLFVFNTDLGWMGIEYSSKGLTRIILPKKSKEDVFMEVDIGDHDIENGEKASYGDLPSRLRHYLAGERIDLIDKLDLVGTTEFQRKVWEVTGTIPYGQTRSYAWVAGRVGCNSARAIGQALSKNPIPILVPCHRVIRSDGSLGGFRGGSALKKLLLDLENID